MVKKICRHEVKTNLDMITHVASQMLKSGGYFAIVHRTSRLNDIIVTMKKYHIEPKRLQLVYPKMNSECNHILIEGIKDGSEGSLRILPPLYVYKEDGKWTDEVLKIYNYEE
jgi:tRNA1(Val) A37 N6-methylase TrmN6